MQEVHTDISEDISSSENFLVHCFRVLFENVLENSLVDKQLKKRVLQFKEFISIRFNWNFELEPDDEAPIVVDTDLM